MTEEVQADTGNRETNFARLYVFDAETVSPQTREIARKNEAAILRYCSKETGSAIAHSVGMADSSFSRWLNGGGMSLAALVLARLGLKAVPADAVVYLKPPEYN